MEAVLGSRPAEFVLLSNQFSWLRACFFGCQNIKIWFRIWHRLWTDPQTALVEKWYQCPSRKNNLYFICCRSSGHTNRRQTAHLKVPYYVGDHFSEEYTGKHLKNVEQSVEDDYISNLRNNCWKEKQQSEWNHLISLHLSIKTFGANFKYHMILQNHNQLRLHGEVDNDWAFSTKLCYTAVVVKVHYHQYWVLELFCICRGRAVISGTVFWRFRLVSKGPEDGHTQLFKAVRHSSPFTWTLKNK